MNLETAWYGNRKITQPETPAANASILVGDALLDSIFQRLEKELPTAAYMGVVAQMPVAAEVGSGDERDELGSG